MAGARDSRGPKDEPGGPTCDLHGRCEGIRGVRRTGREARRAICSASVRDSRGPKDWPGGPKCDILGRCEGFEGSEGRVGRHDVRSARQVRGIRRVRTAEVIIDGCASKLKHRNVLGFCLSKSKILWIYNFKKFMFLKFFLRFRKLRI